MSNAVTKPAAEEWPKIDVEAELGDIRQWTVGNVVARRARLNGDKTFLSYLPDGRSYNFRDAERYANGIAHALMAQGIRKGDHVAMLAENCPEIVFGNFGLGMIGAVSVP